MLRWHGESCSRWLKYCPEECTAWKAWAFLLAVCLCACMQQASGAHSDTYTLVTFADWSTVCFECLPSGHAYEQLRSHLNNLVPRCGTNYCSGLKQALTTCKSVERLQPHTCQHIIIFLSDGGANCRRALLCFDAIKPAPGPHAEGCMRPSRFAALLLRLCARARALGPMPAWALALEGWAPPCAAP